MDLTQAEQAILARFKARCHIAGGVQPGYGMRANAIKLYQPPGADFDAALRGMVEKGWLKVNAAGTWYFLSAEGAERVKAA
ncbi:MAG TPA: hypothetical protein VGX68_04855 [Thermoanaerobaculia bacterium]|jgi:hypothetical protein|nr:hypothetical protein [Thermoanaerobaculia bacterium]